MGQLTSTEQYGVIGDPISHSQSPSIHKFFAKQLGQNINYKAYHVTADKLESFIIEFQNKGGKGLNITLPHKTSVLNCTDEISSRAMEAGAINTLIINEKKIKIEKNKDCVLLVGQDLARSAKLLCFDEMEVRDIADAMILSRLFNVMFSYGTTLVTTSNQPPTGLYKNGLHRDRILPFIENLKLKTEIIEIQNGDDWRERSLSGNKVWLSPINKENKKKINNIFLKLSLGFVKQSETIEISGRTIFIPQVAAGIAKIDFDDLCNKPLAASDYIEIGQRYKGIIIENIPVLDDKSRNETRRFIWLIAVSYTHLTLPTKA